MLGIYSREDVIQNLKDAGCSEKTIGSFLASFDKNEKEQQLKLLELQRNDLLKRVHKEEKRISCLDYLVYQIQQTVV